jgi:hypothetical protein
MQQSEPPTEAEGSHFTFVNPHEKKGGRRELGIALLRKAMPSFPD